MIARILTSSRSHGPTGPPIPGLAALWKITKGDRRVTIAVIDGPVDVSHPCFAGVSLQTLHLKGRAPVICRSRSQGSCNHGTQITSLVYRDQLTVLKINISRAVRFRETYLGPLQMTPSFLFFRHGQPAPTAGRVARLLGLGRGLGLGLGRSAFIASTRAGLEKRIRAVLTV
jgi:hypothetical protein